MAKERKGKKHSNISLWLDGYNDIFSDFDPRDPSIRAISVDFLDEARRAAKDKSEGLELNLLMPEKERDERVEHIIQQRLKRHFERHHLMLKDEMNSLIRTGIIFVLAGIIVMGLATYILVDLEKSHFASFLLVLLEPAGWFFFWEGLSMVIFNPKEKKAELEFYRKLSDAEINFGSY